MARIKKEAPPDSKTKLKGKVGKRKVAAITPKLKKIVKQEAVTQDLKLLKPESKIKAKPLPFVLAPPSIVDRNQVRNGVSALFQYIEKTSAGKVELFDEEQPIFLQVAAIKIPNVPNRQIRFALKHSVLTQEGEICLIVKDVGKPKEHEETIEYFEELLKAKGITNVTTIMPYHQFRTEYGEFELKRKLLALYDHFLVDGRICGYTTHLLGGIFMEKRKLPVPIKMDTENLREQFEFALKKTAMKIHNKGDSYQVQVGHTKMKEELVFENIVGLVDQLSQEFPGGFDNIRGLGIKTEKSIAIPIYFTLRSRTDIKVPLVARKLPKAYQNVTGELTTYNNREVTVLPSGKVIVHDTSKNSDNSMSVKEEDDFQIEDDELEYSSPKPKKDEKKKIKQENKAKRVKVEEETEEEAQAVDAYLNDYNGKINTSKKSKKNKAEEDDAEESDEEQNSILDEAEEMYLNDYEQEQINIKKIKKTNARNKPDEVKAPLKKKKKAISQGNSKGTNIAVEVLGRNKQKKGAVVIKMKQGANRGNKVKEEEIATKKPKGKKTNAQNNSSENQQVGKQNAKNLTKKSSILSEINTKANNKATKFKKDKGQIISILETENIVQKNKKTKASKVSNIQNTETITTRKKRKLLQDSQNGSSPPKVSKLSKEDALENKKTKSKKGTKQRKENLPQNFQKESDVAKPSKMIKVKKVANKTKSKKTISNGEVNVDANNKKQKPKYKGKVGGHKKNILKVKIK